MINARKALVCTLVSLLAASCLAQTRERTSAALLRMPPVLGAFPQEPLRSPRSLHPGRDRFSPTPALSTRALVETLKTNKTFRKNLAKHFGIPEERVVDFVQDALVPWILPQDTRVINYGVRKTGRIYGKRITLKKGTRVWATRDGKPILKWDCSNPLLTKAPVPPERPQPSTVSLSTPYGILPVPASLLAPAELEASVGAALPTEPLFFTPPPVTFVEEPPLTDSPQSGPRLFSDSDRRRLPFIPLVGLIGPTKPSETANNPSLPQSQPSSNVPEPITAVLLSLGIIGLLALQLLSARVSVGDKVAAR